MTLSAKLVSICYLEHEDKILMLHRYKKREGDIHEGKYLAPGGRFESGESPEECISREYMEETGLTLINPIQKGTLTFTSERPNDTSYAFVFIADEFNGQLKECKEGKLEWIADSELLGLNIWESDRIFLPWLKKPGYFSAKFIYREHKLHDYTVSFYNL